MREPIGIQRVWEPGTRVRLDASYLARRHPKVRLPHTGTVEREDRYQPGYFRVRLDGRKHGTYWPGMVLHRLQERDTSSTRLDASRIGSAERGEDEPARPATATPATQGSATDDPAGLPAL
jgi:hypothetical protein